MPQNNDSGRSGISDMSDRRSLVIPNDVFFGQVAETLAGGSPVTFIVKGYSMYPFMRNGKDSVCLEWYDGRALSAGEVILFQYRGKHVLHRIYKTEAAPDGAMLYRTMGDGNLRGIAAELRVPHGQRFEHRSEVAVFEERVALFEDLVVAYERRIVTFGKLRYGNVQKPPALVRPVLHEAEFRGAEKHAVDVAQTCRNGSPRPPARMRRLPPCG